MEEERKKGKARLYLLESILTRKNWKKAFNIALLNFRGYNRNDYVLGGRR